MTEAIGSILTIAITVAMMAGVFVTFLRVPPAVNTVHADLAVAVNPGAGDWNTGDEQVVLTHQGGEALDQAQTTVQVRVQGGTVSSYAGTALGFPGGRLQIGQQWVRLLTLPANATVEVTVVSAGALLADGVVATVNQAAGCPLDASAPFVSAWQQIPADLQAASVGPVQVQATVQDDCAGPDDSVVPHLYYRADNGTHPAYADGGAMASSGIHQWSGAVPDLGWANQAGATLQYYVSPLRDLLNHTGGSGNASDYIQVVGTPTFVSSFVANTGSVANFANAQSAADGGAYATLTEANTAGPPVTKGYGAIAVVSAPGWTSPGNALAADGANATTTGSNNALRVGVAGEPGNPGQVTDVVLHATAAITNAVNDGFTLQACLGATCGAASPLMAANANATVLSYDVVGLRPGGGLWSAADIANLTIVVTSAKSGSADGTWTVDYAWANVTYTPLSAFGMDVELDFSGVPAGGLQHLELQYSVSPNADTFTVYVWNSTSATWSARGVALDQASPVLWGYTLQQPGEWNAGAPRLRIVDAHVRDSVQTQVFLDFARVVTS